MRSSAHSWLSTEQPAHTFAGHAAAHRSGAIRIMFSGRFVSNNQSSRGVASISDQSFDRSSATAGCPSNTSAIELQKTRARLPDRSAAAFHFSGSAQCFSPKVRRPVVFAGPQTRWP